MLRICFMSIKWHPLPRAHTPRRMRRHTFIRRSPYSHQRDRGITQALDQDNRNSREIVAAAGWHGCPSAPLPSRRPSPCTCGHQASCLMAPCRFPIATAPEQTSNALILPLACSDIDKEPTAQTGELDCEPTGQKGFSINQTWPQAGTDGGGIH